MPQPTAVILVVGLTQSVLKHAPRMAAFAAHGRVQRLRPVLPAVTCSVQSSMVTGLTPREHGIVGNGWYDRELAEIHFWKQSNHLVHGPKVWETARQRDPSITTANLFWWFNMYSSAEFSVTPRPIYKADGRKLPDCYTAPAELRDRLQAELGPFPLFQFWGPEAGIESSRWIAAAAQRVLIWHHPTLSLVYLPHLDYALQKFGPELEVKGEKGKGKSAEAERGAANPGAGERPSPVGADADILSQRERGLGADPRIAAAVSEIDRVVGELIDSYERWGVRVMIVSEYGIEPVDDAVHINRQLRQAGLLRVREEQGGELLDAGASDAFAVADHQVAHVYLQVESGKVKSKKLEEQTAEICRGVAGVEQVLDRTAQAAAGLDHPRSGDLVLVASPRRWFSYYYWLDDARAPDFARTVEIHRKPGYDPAELFLDPRIRFPKMAIAGKLLKRKLGMRTLMDVIPLDARLVRGSHGRVALSPENQPVLITAGGAAGTVAEASEELPCTAVRDVILGHLFGKA